MDALTGDGLPPGWARAALSDLIECIEAGKNVAAIGRPPGENETGIVKVSAVTWGEFDEEESKTLPPDIEIDPRHLIRPGDFLISRANTIELVGAPVIVKQFRRRLMLSDKVLRLRVVDGFDRWLELFLKSHFGRAQIEQYATGAQLSMRNISQENLRRIAVPVAPAQEQIRIVATVNALFEEVEVGEAALARARESLTQFRASLLHAACTGALTADWRAANPTNETGRDLLVELLGARRARWEADFRAKAARTGKRLRDEAWKARYPSPRLPDLTDMPELPDGWTWASLDQLAHDSNYGTSVKCDGGADGLAVLRIPNVQAGSVTWSNLKFATNDLGLDAADLLAPGDLLVVRTNGSPDLVGRAALIEGAPPRPAYFASYLIRFRLVGSAMVQRWVASVFQSWLVRTQVARFAATSAGQYNVSQTNLAGFAIPLPPESEIEAALDALTEATADDGAMPFAGFADQLRQSILHAAFSGRLVPQDPADEPAAALLARLRTTPATARRPRRRATQPDLIETPA